MDIAQRTHAAIRFALVGAAVALAWTALAFVLGLTSSAAHAATTPDTPPSHGVAVLVGSLTSRADSVATTTDHVISHVGAVAAETVAHTTAAASRLSAVAPVAKAATTAAGPGVTRTAATLSRTVVVPLNHAVTDATSAVVGTVARVPIVGTAARDLGVTQAVTAITRTVDQTVSGVTGTVTTTAAQVLTGAAPGAANDGTTPGTTTPVSAPDAGWTGTTPPSTLSTGTMSPGTMSTGTVPAGATMRTSASVAQANPAVTQWPTRVFETLPAATNADAPVAVASVTPQPPGAPAASGDCVATGLCLPGTSGTGMAAAAMLAAGLIITRRLLTMLPAREHGRLLPALALAPDVRPG